MSRLVILPALLFASWMVPFGKSPGKATSALLQSSVALFGASVLNSGIQIATGKSWLENLTYNFALLLMFWLSFVENRQVYDNSDGPETNDISKDEVKSKFMIMDRVLGFVSLLYLSFGTKEYHTYLITFAVVTFMDVCVIRRVQILKRLCFLAGLVRALVMLALLFRMDFDNNFTTKSFNQGVLFACCIMYIVIFHSRKILLNVLEERSFYLLPRVQNLYEDEKSVDGRIKEVQDYPHLYFLLSRCWTLLIPFPALLALWTATVSLPALDNSNINFDLILNYAYLALLFTVSLIFLLSPSSRFGRSCSRRITELVIFACWARHAYVAPESTYRVLISGLYLLALASIQQVSDLYRKMDNFPDEQRPLICSRLTFSDNLLGRVSKFLVAGWIELSSFFSALMVFSISVILQEHEIIKMVMSTWIGMFPNTYCQYSWTILGTATLLHQSVSLFTAHNSQFTSNLYFAAVGNLIILVLAEAQRLRYLDSIYPMATSKDQLPESKVEKATIFDRLLNFVRKSSGNVSIFFLIGILLFHPQLTSVSLQTASYSVWAAVFVFLFYRPEETSLLRLYCIRCLALMSATYFIYNSAMESIKFPENIRYAWISDERFRNQVIHGFIFWLSCASLFGFSLKRNLEEERKESDEQSHEPRPANIISDIRAFAERLFVLYWTRVCALLAFLAAAFNPSIFGVGHLFIGSVLVYQSVLSREKYLLMIGWLELAIFVPAIMPKVPFLNSYLNFVQFCVGRENSFLGTVCLTILALLLFLQPYFIECLGKYSSKEDRKNYLVSFQILPLDEEETRLNPKVIESFENSCRYYLSNWFIEFHEELMVSALIAAAMTKLNIFGVLCAVLAVLQIAFKDVNVRILAYVSLSLQITFLIAKYIINALAVARIVFPSVYMTPKMIEFMDLSNLSSFEAIDWYSTLMTSSLNAMFIFLTIRWFLTRTYCIRTQVARRFDTHWCKLCGSVTKKASHGYSHIKLKIHLYIGWAAHAALFVVSITANKRPTVPTAALMILSLVFLLFGESNILIPNLRDLVYTSICIIALWSVLHPASLLFSPLAPKDDFYNSVLKYAGLMSFNFEPTVHSTHSFNDPISVILLGLAVFLLLLQMRIIRSPAFPFILARFYQSILASSKRAKAFNEHLNFLINYQQSSLKKAMEHVRLQMNNFNHIDISNWKKLCYVPPESEDEKKTVQLETPRYGNSAPSPTISIVRQEDSSESDSDSGAEVRRRSSFKYREHLSQMNSKAFSDTPADDEQPRNLAASGSDQSKQKELHDKRKLQKNFYLYTLAIVGRGIVKFLLSNASEYRKLEKRPSERASLRIVFHHHNWVYRCRYFVEILVDFFNANFDYVLDALAMDAHMFHSSGFSLVVVFTILMVARLQRPFTGSAVNTFLIVFTSAWIFLNYCTVLAHANGIDASGIAHQKFIGLARGVISNAKFDKHLLNRTLGLHQITDMVNIIRRPTLILLALSYKRSLMRYVGLWQFSHGLKMAREYCRSEEDVSEEFQDEMDLAENKDVSDTEDEMIASLSAESEFELSIDSTGSSSVADSETAVHQPSLWDIWKPTIAMPWRDYYVPMFAADFVCFMLQFYYWGDFMLGPNGNKNERIFFAMIEENLVPRSLVTMILANTFLLILDRALYVSKNYTGKLLLQICSLVGTHMYVFYYLPTLWARSSGEELYSLFGVRMWYLFRWIYWVSSALQLRYSYPPLRTDVFLNSTYNMFTYNLRVMYKNIPFLHVLRITVDWSASKSSLGLWPWLKLADITDRLYGVQCGRSFQRSYYGRHVFGERLNQINKFGQGAVALIVFVLFLWSPFLVLSSSSSGNTNHIDFMKMEFSVKGYGAPFATFTASEFNEPSYDEYTRLKSYEGVNGIEVDSSFFSKTSLSLYSQAESKLTDVNKAMLLNHLQKADKSAKLVISWSIKRVRSQEAPILTGKYEYDMTEKMKRDFSELLQDCTEDSKEFAEVNLLSVMPELLDAPLKGYSTSLSQSGFGVRLRKHCPTKNYWEKLRHAVKTKHLHEDGSMKKVPSYSLSQIDSDEPVPVFIYSVKLPIINSTSFNLVGLYATMVIGMAQLIQLMHNDMTTRIPLDELPNPMPLLNMCRQISMVREMGDYESEEAIYWQLIEIIRDPKLLIEMTKID